MGRLPMVVCGSLVGAFFATGVAAQDSVTMVSFGGSYQDAMRTALYAPAAQHLGITIREDQLKGIADVRLQVASGAPTWDIVELARQYCMSTEANELFEPLDFSLIPNASTMGDSLKGERWVGGPIYYSYVLAWNPNKYPTPPESWADFFDIEKFPGSRALYTQARFMIELALLADGVSKDEMYPLDVDRGLNKVSGFADNITTFFTTNGQAVQLMKDEEIDMIAMTDGRAQSVKKDGGNIAYTYNQGIIDAGCLAIPKGAPNKELAMKVINELIAPENQKNVPDNFFPYGPVQPAAYGEGLIPPDVAANLNSGPNNISKQMLLNSAWWAEHESEVQPRWDALVQK